MKFVFKTSQQIRFVLSHQLQQTCGNSINITTFFQLNPSMFRCLFILILLHRCDTKSGELFKPFPQTKPKQFFVTLEAKSIVQWLETFGNNLQTGEFVLNTYAVDLMPKKSVVRAETEGIEVTVATTISYPNSEVPRFLHGVLKKKIDFI